MFKLFRKKKLIKVIDYEFLKAVVDVLPMSYYYLIDQVSKEFILDKKVNELGDKGTYTLILNSNLESRYANKSFPQLFIIRDIGVWNKVNSTFEQIELHILEGMIAGFKVNEDYDNLDFEKIDISKIKEKHFKDEDRNKLRSMIGEVSMNVLSQLDIESTFKIELEEGNFYVLKDLKNGNYLAMNTNGSVYAMIHDPYKIEKLFENKELFLEAINSGKFNISEYYDKKLS